MKRGLIFATTYFPLVGGAEVALKEVTDRLTDREFDLVCARIRPGLPSTEKIGNVTVHRAGIGHPIDKFLLPVLGPLTAFGLSGGERDVVWSLMASYGGFAALTYCKLRPRSKLLLTLQEGDPLEHYAKRAGFLSFMHGWIFQRADAVQAISRFLADWATRMGFRGAPDVVPNGVDIARFTALISADRRHALRSSFGYTDSDVVVVTASRLSLKNGVDDLIRSFVTLPEQYHALIIGDGEDRDKLRVLTEKKDLVSRVQFLGQRGHDELPDLLRASDIFCRPSLSEGLGNSFLEAMAAGLPIVGTPVGGIPDFLTDGETGVFCRVNDPTSIAAAFQRIETEPGLRQRLSQNGEKLVRERYDWTDIARRIRVILERLAA